MSADNTVVVLRTKGKSGSGSEYRVAHVQAMENMFYEADYPSPDITLLNREWTLNAFRGVQVFTDAEAALDKAAELEASGYVEYGIRVFDFSTIFFPAARRKWRWSKRIRRNGDDQRASLS